MNISPKAKETTDRLNDFMDKHVYPNNETYHSQIENFGADRWQVVPVIEDLKKEAKKEDLWNLFLPESDYGHGLTRQSMRQCVKSWGEQCGLRKFSIVLLLIPVIWKF